MQQRSGPNLPTPTNMPHLRQPLHSLPLAHVPLNLSNCPLNVAIVPASTLRYLSGGIWDELMRMLRKLVAGKMVGRECALRQG